MNNHDGYAVDAVKCAAQLDEEGMVKVPTSGTLTIATLHTEYVFDADRGIMSGGICGTGKKARIDGATFGGSLIALDRLYLDSHMEFAYWDDERWHIRTTSPIQILTYVERSRP